MCRSLEILLDLRSVRDCPGKRSNNLCLASCHLRSRAQRVICDSRRLNTSPATRDVVRKSYEFALQHVGQDKDSGQIWSDYIQFIKSGEVRMHSIYHSQSHLLTACQGYDDLGGTAKNGCAQKSLSSRRADTVG